MSPYPSKVNRDDLILRARAIIESDGADALSVNQLAAAFGIKPASLYNHFESKTALLAAVNAVTLADLVGAVSEAAETAAGDTPSRFLSMARAYRAYARAHPAAYGLAFTNTIAGLQPNADFAEKLALPLQAYVGELTGGARSLAGLRGLWALMHGFIMLEIGGHFRRGGSLDEAFEESVLAYVRGLSK